MKRILLPLMILVVAGAATWLTIKYKQEPEKKEVKRVLPAVEVIEAMSRPYTLEIRTSGVIEAPTMTMLTAEVSGRIIEVAPVFENGGVF